MRVLLPFLSLLLLPPAVAEEEELRLLAAELPPYTFRIPPHRIGEFVGPGQGIVHEIVVDIARRIGHSGRIEYLPWHRAQDIAMTRDNIGILALTRSPEREPNYRWMVKILTDDLILVGGQGVDVSGLDKVKDRPIGVLRRSGAEALLEDMGFSRIEPASEEWINARKLKQRYIDAWLAPRLMVIHGYREVGGDPEKLNIGRIIRASEIYLAASKTLSDAKVARWRAAFDRLKADGGYDKILEKYYRLKVKPIPEGLRKLQNKKPIWNY
jgi:polar amino acid transport system substrate-binding protein